MSYSKLAYEIAKRAHEGQKDKAGVDYIHHPEKVANMVESDTEKSVAYLHDVVEDTFVTLKMLEVEGFPSEVIKAIDAITKRKDELYDDYLQRVSKNPIALKVKIADMKHNSDVSRHKQPSSKDWERAAKYRSKIEMLLGHINRCS